MSAGIIHAATTLIRRRTATADEGDPGVEIAGLTADLLDAVASRWLIHEQRSTGRKALALARAVLATERDGR